uniref:Uncharacterized protein n=1 Tax=Aegilops tauschii subsp. strangulata TaxID=200361 RepID=A0A452XK38_AEGTS
HQTRSSTSIVIKMHLARQESIGSLQRPYTSGSSPKSAKAN